MPIHWKDWCRSWSSNTLATSCKELTHLKGPWYWERLKAGWEGDDRGWDGWIASPTWWTWVWARSGCWWWTGKPGMLQLMGSQRVGHNWATELRSCLCVGILFPVFLPIFKFRTTYFTELVITTDSVAGLRVNGQHLPVNVHFAHLISRAFFTEYTLYILFSDSCKYLNILWSTEMFWMSFILPLTLF